MRVEYKVDGGLIETLHVVQELRAISGMEPNAIVMNDGRRVKFQYRDYKQLVAGKIDQEAYISRNIFT